MNVYDSDLEENLFSLLYSFLPPENFSGDFVSLRSIFSPYDKAFKNGHVPIITIAGTNGKGETCFHLRTLLERADKKVAVFSSPHILSLRERFYFEGSNISYDELKKALELCRDNLKGQILSFYEFLFLAFCQLCKERIKSLDYIILEVGLGGRKDTVNLLNPTLTAITSISRDHQEILGHRFDQILFEKLGICRSRAPLVTLFSSTYLREITQDYCLENSIEYLDLNQYMSKKMSKSYSMRNKMQAFYLYRWLQYEKLDEVKMTKEDFFSPKLKGRFEMMTMGKNRFIFIGAHNIDGIRMLEETLRQEVASLNIQLPVDEFWIAFSKREMKDVEAAIKIFKDMGSLYRKIWVTSFKHPKALDLDEEKLDKIDKIDSSFSQMMDWKKKLTVMDRDVKTTVAITGSYYFVGEVQKEILSLKSVF